jgi:small subunit ribosomal protein S8
MSICDLFTRLRNGYRSNAYHVLVRKSKFAGSILEVFKKNKYIEDFEEMGYNYNVKLRYVNGQPAMRYIKAISKPGRAVYVKSGGFPRPKFSFSLFLISSSKGIMTHVDAYYNKTIGQDGLERRQSVGGMLLCEVF